MWDCYSEAIMHLNAGAMPVIVPIGDELHLLSIVPTSRNTLARMVSEDQAVREQFITTTVKAVHETLSEYAS